MILDKYYLKTNGLRFEWKKGTSTINIFNIDSDDAFTCHSIDNKSSLRDFKAFVKRWLKENNSFNEDGWLLEHKTGDVWK